MSTLVITVLGPFAYVPNAPMHGFITLMAPLCPLHSGGISGVGKDCEFLFTGNRCNRGTDFKARKPFVYALGIHAGDTDPKWKKEGNVLKVAKATSDYDPKHWRFWVVLPLPDLFVTVNPVKMSIEAPVSIPDPPYAVGVRFIYKQWDRKDMVISLNGSVTNGDKILPVFHFGDYGEDDHWDLEIEYSGLLRNDPDHDDAVNCFETLMASLGHNDWSVGFPIPQDKQTEVVHQNDCLAAIAWVE